MLRHLLENLIGNTVAGRAVFNSVGLRGQCAGNILRVTGVNHDWQPDCVGILGYGVQDTKIHSVIEHASDSAFQNRLDAIYLARGQCVHLLFCFRGTLRRADKLTGAQLLYEIGRVLEVFGSVPAFGGKERPAEEQLRSKLFAKLAPGAGIDGFINEITSALNGGDTAVKVSCQIAIEGAFGVVILLVFRNAAGSAKMNVNADQSGKLTLTIRTTFGNSSSGWARR